MLHIPELTLKSALTAALILLPIIYILSRLFPTSLSSSSRSQEGTSQTPAEKDLEEKKPLKSVMQAPRTDLAPPKDDPYSLDELKQFDGSDVSKPIYVAIKGTIFDVSHKSDVYGPGKSYNVFAGKDGSKGLGMSSLKPEDAVPDYTTLDEKDMKVLNDWHAFFTKRYNVVGKVSDGPVINK